MYDKELYDKILNVSCTFEELSEFNSQFGDKNKANIFDLDSPFEKYYDVNIIIYAIEKYQKKEIDDRYLACWAKAYNEIIRAGFDSIEYGDYSPIKELLMYEISDCLYWLSCSDEEDEYFDLEENKEDYRILDIVYRDADDCRAIFAYYKDDKIVILVSNDKKKYYISLYRFCGFDYKCRVELDYLENYEKQLIKDGYVNLISIID